ncbi:hypothetical protein [Engelhardtia mirabilis]|uniref:Aminoglycoside phosphotransferase domain-containing protein n=1 Tax=Engelhardtia mirabilis TaxID=2528011 RepID=A0A518BDM2_9BACT|nr:hypothetical protein Pla133_01500 [Planctomycetes bacterium Pla133]QDU99413.1 hypothetical protein Pla86_01500 [Planctomycetes bacterium Pla86]
MVTPDLTAAVQWIGKYLGDDGVAQRVRRTDVDTEDRLLIELDGNDGATWFRIAPAVLRELLPVDERELPLATWFAASDEACRLVSWTPGTRMVVAVERSGGTEFWRGLRPECLAEATRRYDLARSLCDGHRGNFALPTLLGVDVERSALRLAAVEGAPPRIQVSCHADFARIGRALRRLQEGQDRLSKPLTSLLSTHTAQDELTLLADHGMRCVVTLGQEPAGFSAVLEQLREALPRGAALVPCVRDLHDGQVLLGGGPPTLLDHDLLCLADPLLDAADLLAHLTLRRLQGQTGANFDAVRACGDALLAGLDRGGLPEYLPRLRFYEATALLRLCAVHALQPRWQPLTADLVRLAERCAQDARLTPA